jgi:hypothetical protein
VTSLAALFFNGPMWMLGVLLFIGWTPIVVVGVCAFCAGVAALFLKETAPRKIAAAMGQRAGEYRRAA